MTRKQVISTALTGLIMGGLATALLIGFGQFKEACLGFAVVTLGINIPLLLYGFYGMKEQPGEAG